MTNRASSNGWNKELVAVTVSLGLLGGNVMPSYAAAKAAPAPAAEVAKKVPKTVEETNLDSSKAKKQKDIAAIADFKVKIGEEKKALSTKRNEINKLEKDLANLEDKLKKKMDKDLKKSLQEDRNSMKASLDSTKSGLKASQKAVESYSNKLTDLEKLLKTDDKDIASKVAAVEKRKKDDAAKAEKAKADERARFLATKVKFADVTAKKAQTEYDSIAKLEKNTKQNFEKEAAKMKEVGTKKSAVSHSSFQISAS
jgi:chromosome segregation ATPase